MAVLIRGVACLAALATPGIAYAEVGTVLRPDDFVGISFWLISMALIAATAFFFLETQRVAGKWKTSLTVSGLVTLVAGIAARRLVPKVPYMIVAVGAGCIAAFVQ
jgi:hypothetical protein